MAGGRGPRHAPSLTAGPAQDGPHFRSPWRKKAPLRSGGRVPGSQRTPVSARHPLAPLGPKARPRPLMHSAVSAPFHSLKMREAVRP